MTTRRRRGLAGLLAVTALAAASLVLSAGPASGADGTNFDPYTDLSNLPIEPILCPEGTGDPAAFLTFCIEMTFDGGQAKFGSVESDVAGPIKIRQVVSVLLGPGGFEDIQLVMIDEGSEGGGGGLSFPTIPVPGGLVGNPQLDALLSPVTGVTATIEPVGELTLNDVDPNPLLNAMFGDETASGVLATANLPFQVRINNLLLGTDCLIGSADSPVELNLPLFLSNVKYWNGSFATPTTNMGYFVLDADATDATFSIPAADGCGILGTGKLLDSLGGLNLFDSLVNQSVGLPAPSGTNLLSLHGYFGLTLPGFDGVSPAPAPEG
jgi:hypothetical protein